MKLPLLAPLPSVPTEYSILMNAALCVLSGYQIQVTQSKNTYSVLESNKFSMFYVLCLSKTSVGSTSVGSTSVVTNNKMSLVNQLKTGINRIFHQLI